MAGALGDLLGRPDIAVDRTPKKFAACNVQVYRQRVLKFIAGGGERHPVAGYTLFFKLTPGARA